MNTIKWNKNFLKDLKTPFKEIEPSWIKKMIMNHYTSQTGADGKSFPNKKSGGKYLNDTGKMINSLKVTIKDNKIILSLGNKGNIYTKYLHDKAMWLGFSKEELEDIMKRIIKNKGWK